MPIINSTIDIPVRFLIVFILSFLYGLNRQKSHKPVGFGTFILVSIGSCALALLADEMDLAISIGLLGAIVTGIGFLGAGALIRNSDKIFGFTTAASIWFFAIFGMLIGLGKYDLGIIIYAMVWIVAFFDKYLEKNAVGSYRRKIVIETRNLVPKKKVTDVLTAHTTEFYLYELFLNKKERTTKMTYVIEGPKNDIEGLLKSFYSKPWCISVKFE